MSPYDDGWLSAMDAGELALPAPAPALEVELVEICTVVVLAKNIEARTAAIARRAAPRSPRA